VAAPERPLTITYPTFSEGRYLDAIGIQSVAEVEVLYLHLMPTGCQAINDVLVLAPRLGSLWQDNDLVFPTTTGTTMSCTNLLGRHFKPLLRTAELPAIRLHDLQHTCATILLMAGKHPKYVQELLGHARINIPLDAYSHVIEGIDGGLGDAMDEAL
jgi:hypothetical protein